MRIGTFWAHTFLLDIIRPKGTIFDFGLNYGGFSNMAAGLCEHVFAFEPNPFWSRERGNGIALPRNVTIVPKAIAAKSGTYTFYLEPEGGTNSSLHKEHTGTRLDEAVTVDAITLGDALALQTMTRIELIKVNIEGEKVPVLQTAPAEALRRAAQLSVEFEPYHSEEVIRSVIQRMESLGFWTVKFSWRNYGDVLFVNLGLEPLSPVQRANIVLVHKYGRGILRVLSRIPEEIGFRRSRH